MRHVIAGLREFNEKFEKENKALKQQVAELEAVKNMMNEWRLKLYQKALHGDVEAAKTIFNEWLRAEANHTTKEGE